MNNTDIMKLLLLEITVFEVRRINGAFELKYKSPDHVVQDQATGALSCTWRRYKDYPTKAAIKRDIATIQNDNQSIVLGANLL